MQHAQARNITSMRCTNTRAHVSIMCSCADSRHSLPQFRYSPHRVRSSALPPAASPPPSDGHPHHHRASLCLSSARACVETSHARTHTHCARTTSHASHATSHITTKHSTSILHAAKLSSMLMSGAIPRSVSFLSGPQSPSSQSQSQHSPRHRHRGSRFSQHSASQASLSRSSSASGATLTTSGATHASYLTQHRETCSLHALPTTPLAQYALFAALAQITALDLSHAATHVEEDVMVHVRGQMSSLETLSVTRCARLTDAGELM